MTDRVSPPASDLEATCDRVMKGLSCDPDAQILGTGLTGPIGIWLVFLMGEWRRRTGASFRLQIVTRNKAKANEIFDSFINEGWVTLLEQDIRFLNLSGSHPDIVIHGATASARESFYGMTGLDKFQGVVQGTNQLLNELDPERSCKIVFLSSGSIFGTTLLEPGQAITQDWPETPAIDEGAALGHAKRAAEAHLTFHSLANPKHTVSICRLFSFVGPLLPLNYQYAVGNFIADVLAGRPIKVQSDGSAVRSFMYLGDMAGWLLRVIFAPNTEGTFMIGSSKPVSILQLANLIREIFNSPNDIEVTGAETQYSRYSASHFYVPETTLSKAALSVDEWTSLEIALSRTAEFLAGTSVGTDSGGRQSL